MALLGQQLMELMVLELVAFRHFGTTLTLSTIFMGAMRKEWCLGSASMLVQEQALMLMPCKRLL